MINVHKSHCIPVCAQQCSILSLSILKKKKILIKKWKYCKLQDDKNLRNRPINSIIGVETELLKVL